MNINEALVYVRGELTSYNELDFGIRKLSEEDREALDALTSGLARLRSRNEAMMALYEAAVEQQGTIMRLNKYHTALDAVTAMLAQEEWDRMFAEDRKTWTYRVERVKLLLLYWWYRVRHAYWTNPYVFWIVNDLLFGFIIFGLSLTAMALLGRS